MEEGLQCNFRMRDSNLALKAVCEK